MDVTVFRFVTLNDVMVMSAKVSRPANSQAARTPASVPAASEASRSSETRTSSTQDSYETSTSPSVEVRSNDQNASSVADPALSPQVELNRVQANVGQRGQLSEVQGGRISDPGDLSSSGVRPAQDAFRQEMRTALDEPVRNPPQERQLRRYFRTFRGRPQAAVQAYERYADAYGRHDGEHDYRSVDRVYVRDSDGRRLSGRREMRQELARGNNVTSYSNNAPDNFREATRDLGRDRRSNMDCEGFTSTARNLLGEAGLNTTAVVGRVSDSEGHVVAVARDPNSNRSWVLSNGDAYPVSGNLRSTLDNAFGDTVISDLPSSYYEASTQDEASARELINGETGRID